MRVLLLFAGLDSVNHDGSKRWSTGYSHNEEEITFDYLPIIIVLCCEKLSDVAVIEFGKLMNENCSSRS